MKLPLALANGINILNLMALASFFAIMWLMPENSQFFFRQPAFWQGRLKQTAID
jgi:hypothetical protein